MCRTFCAPFVSVIESKQTSDTQEESRSQREELRRGLLELSNLMTDIKTSDDSIKEKAVTLRKLHKKNQDRRLDAILDARKVLNDEQKQQIHDKIQELISGSMRPHRISMSIDQNVNAYLYDD